MPRTEAAMSPATQGKLSTYQSVAAHGAVAAADPYRLVLMLLDGALARIAQARVSGAQSASLEKTQHLQRALAIVGELRASLDLTQGPLARNLDALYDFVSRQLLLGQSSNDPAVLDTASNVLSELRGGWAAMPQGQGVVRP
jgi:flagellar protein FliS